ncbi:DUF1919 domain-containing protein [Polaribacter sp. IC073]|uniref:DUF1919 domain-containing protein n=1 Tax=Polaribacter sp. IC073 TaxID=2508540 RepID=UPI0011BEAA46|nr:DUF1919 domain-containing protein [Polaribacter sp. IC073]TXD46425.1 DUF1919 domain-containing protein [Polaribacter sp. IC073]
MNNNFFRELFQSARRRYRRIFQEKISKKDIATLKDINFVIISNNCWGGKIYKWLKRPFNSPFIGLGVKGDCYLKILSNFDYYMGLPLKFTKISKYPDREITYPLGILDDVEIHFTHYESKEEAHEKWNRRKNRMLENNNKNLYIFKICNSWDSNREHFKLFNELPYKNKISFTIYDYKDLNLKNNFYVKESDKSTKDNMVNGSRLFILTFIYLNIFKWIKNNTVNNENITENS